MPIPVQNNTDYGGNLVNQKYAPLAINAVQIDNTVQAEYVALFTQRINLLTGQGILPRQLKLYAANWPAIHTAESAPGALPPIVVVSSNRAEWIFCGYDLAENLREPPANFNDVNDVGALIAGPTPWYLPRRISDTNRHVYIFVHRKEYAYYQKQLANTGMTVIGWEFDINRVVDPGGFLPRDKTYVGFGASRFAALEFCKYIFNTLIAPALPAGRQKAWLVDDNVTYVQGFAGFATIEDLMDENIWSIGFSGATQNSTNEQVKVLVATNPPLGDRQEQGLLQQCVLWNIDQLNAQHLNYSPYFITSNEDTSFSRFLQGQNPSKLRIVTSATVVKANPTHDDSPGAKAVGQLRDTAVANYFDIEFALQVNGNAGDVSLLDYIGDTVLPNAQENVRRQWPIYPESIAVEQLMAKIVADRLNWVPPWIFRPNGAAPQLTQHF